MLRAGDSSTGRTQLLPPRSNEVPHLLPFPETRTLCVSSLAPNRKSSRDPGDTSLHTEPRRDDRAFPAPGCIECLMVMLTLSVYSSLKAHLCPGEQLSVSFLSTEAAALFSVVHASPLPGL